MVRQNKYVGICVYADALGHLDGPKRRRPAENKEKAETQLRETNRALQKT